jgi:hypothetical protein
MDNLNFLGSFDSVWIYLKYYGCVLILRFANMWNILIYYTCSLRIKELLWMLLFILYWWAVVLSIFPTGSFLLLWPHLTPSSACHSFCVIPSFFINSVLLLIWNSDGYYNLSKIYVVHLAGVVQCCWNLLYTCLFTYLLLNVLWLLRHALHHLSQSDR